MSNTNFSGSFVTQHADGSVTLSPQAAHCAQRLIALTDDDTRRELGLNRHEERVIDEVYGEMAAAGVGGHVDGLTPAFRPASDLHVG